MFETTIDNGYDEVEVEVDFDYQPYEAMTRHYPGCSESIDINEVRVVDTQAEICLLKPHDDLLAEQVMEWVHEEQEYSKYGYMMD